jgi:GntR family transcriptional regulator
VLAPINIDSRDPTPIYAQLDRSIRVAVATGKIKPGDQLPTVRQLAVDLRVNANTVAKVYLTLERDGVVETKRGVGTFISDSPPKTAPRQRDRHLDSLVGRFLTDGTTHGFTPRELLEALTRRVKEGERS